MKKELLKNIISGSKVERDSAANEICRSKMTDLIDDLIPLMQNINPEVREICTIILGVLGGKKAEEYLIAVSKNDPETNVRIAAIISRQFIGKTTIENLISEIRRFRGDKEESNDKKPPMSVEQAMEDKEIRQAQSSKKLTTPSGSRLAGLFNLIRTNRIAQGSIFVISLIFVFIIYNSIRNDNTDINKREKSSKESLEQFILDRILTIDNFKKTALNSSSPLSQFPRTLELKSISGDTYGDLFNRVYSNILTNPIGLNTIGAFWRHMNFGIDKKQNIIDLMDMETSGETLLFPNFAAMNLKLDVVEGTISYHTLNNKKDIEINIRIDDVIVR